MSWYSSIARKAESVSFTWRTIFSAEFCARAYPPSCSWTAMDIDEDELLTQLNFVHHATIWLIRNHHYTHLLQHLLHHYTHLKRNNCMENETIQWWWQYHLLVLLQDILKLATFRICIIGYYGHRTSKTIKCTDKIKQTSTGIYMKSWQLCN